MKRIVRFVLLILVVAVFASCSNNDYLNVIPKESALVMSVDLASIAEKGDLANSELKNTLSEAVSSLKKADQDKVKEYQDDPAKLGIDLREPVYIFMSSNNYAGITMKLHDEAKFSELLETLRTNGICSKVVEKNGRKYGSIEECQFAYNDNTFVLISSLTLSSKSADTAYLASLLKQTEENSFAGSAEYDKLTDNKGDVQLYFNMNIIQDDNVRKEVRKLTGVRLSDFASYVSTDFKDGKMVLTAQTEGRSEEAKKYIEQSYEFVNRIDGRYIDIATDNTLFWLGANVKGESYMKILKKNKDISQALSMISAFVDVEKIVNSIDGDFALAIGGDMMSGINYLATAQLKNSDFMADADSWSNSASQNGLALNKTGNNQYTVSFDANTMSAPLAAFGVDDDNLYFASENGLLKNAFTKHSNMLEDYRSDIKGSYAYAYLDLDKTVSMFSVYINMIPGAGKRLSCLKSLILRSEKKNECEIIVELKDSKTNFLKQMF